MTSAPERALAFLDGTAPDPPVCLQTYLGLYLEPARREALVDVYLGLLGGSDRVEVSPEQIVDAELGAWERAWSRLRHPPAWMPLKMVHLPAEGATIRREGARLLLERAGRQVDLADATTSSHRDVWDRRETTGADPGKLIPSREASDQQLRAEAETGARALGRWGRDQLLHASMGMPFWTCYSVLGFAGLMESVHGDPGLMQALLERATDDALQRVRLIAASGARCLFIEECLSSSDLISEADYLRLSYPAAQAVLNAARDAGLRTVYYYCGSIEGRLEHLARLPADVLAFEEGKKGFDVDLARVREAVGEERPLLGNIDTTAIRDADEAGVRRLVRRQLESAGPLLATSAGSPLTLDTPTEKLDAMVRATEAVLS